MLLWGLPWLETLDLSNTELNAIPPPGPTGQVDQSRYCEQRFVFQRIVNTSYLKYKLISDRHLRIETNHL